MAFTTTYYNMVDLLIYCEEQFWEASVRKEAGAFLNWHHNLDLEVGMVEYQKQIYSQCAKWAIENGYRVSQYLK
jgi:hypothetical protein